MEAERAGKVRELVASVKEPNATYMDSMNEWRLLAEKTKVLMEKEDRCLERWEQLATLPEESFVVSYVLQTASRHPRPPRQSHPGTPPTLCQLLLRLRLRLLRPLLSSPRRPTLGRTPPRPTGWSQ